MLRFCLFITGLIIGPLFWVATPVAAQDDHGFQFVRIKYDDGNSGGESGFGGRRGRGRGGAWAHDYPTAEQNFHEALERTTKVHVGGANLILSLRDKKIFEHPLLYLCEPGYWVMDEEEEENLREYLKRGGFILFDDFRGEREYLHFLEQMKRVLPGKTATELPNDHPIWSIYYEVDPVAAPSNVSGGGYFTELDDKYVAFFDDGRIIGLACYNQDIGDGWEWPDRNWGEVSTISFQMGINFLIYALTH